MYELSGDGGEDDTVPSVRDIMDGMAIDAGLNILDADGFGLSGGTRLFLICCRIESRTRLILRKHFRCLAYLKECCFMLSVLGKQLMYR